MAATLETDTRTGRVAEHIGWAATGEAKSPRARLAPFGLSHSSVEHGGRGREVSTSVPVQCRRPLALYDHTPDAGMHTLSPKPKRMAKNAAWHEHEHAMRHARTHVDVTSHNTHPHPQHSWAVRRHAAGPQAQPPSYDSQRSLLHAARIHAAWPRACHTHATDPVPHLQRSCQAAALATSQRRHVAAITPASSCCASGSSAESPKSTPYCISSSSVAQKRVPLGKKNS